MTIKLLARVPISDMHIKVTTSYLACYIVVTYYSYIVYALHANQFIDNLSSYVHVCIYRPTNVVYEAYSSVHLNIYCRQALLALYV